MKNILLVEDDRVTQTVVRQALSSLGHELVIVETAEAALAAIGVSEIQLIILDLSLPDGNGLDLCAKLQADEKTREIPIFMLTGHEEISSKVAAFSIGVEDYVVKPFNPLELRARIEAKLRKLARIIEQDEVFSRGALRLNVSRQKAYRSEKGAETDLELTALEFRLLYQMAKREEHVLSRDQILSLVWGDSSEVLDRTVDAHVSMLRKKLGSLSSCVQAVHGQGYRFSAKPPGRAKKPD